MSALAPMPVGSEKSPHHQMGAMLDAQEPPLTPTHLDGALVGQPSLEPCPVILPHLLESPLMEPFCMFQTARELELKNS